MRQVAVDSIKEGDILAKNIYDDNGNILLTRGTVFKPQYVNRLQNLGLNMVFIEDEITTGVEIDEIVSEGTRLQVKKITKEALTKVKTGKSLESKQIRQAINDVMDEVIRNRRLLVHLSDVRSKSDAVFGHSVSVCVLSLLTAVGMEYDQGRLRDLGMGALLHDIGKALIPEEVLNSTAPLGEAQKLVLRKHAEYGFEALRKTDISLTAAHVAWQHHENYDGTGYPRKLKGKDIHEFARIVAVADYYDNLTNGAQGRTKVLPHQVIENIQAHQDTYFDPVVVKNFVRNIAPYPVTSTVKLNSGETGIVVEVIKDLPTRPKVKITKDGSGDPVAEPYIMDLTKELTTFVTEVTFE